MLRHLGKCTSRHFFLYAFSLTKTFYYARIICHWFSVRALEAWVRFTREAASNQLLYRYDEDYYYCQVYSQRLLRIWKELPRVRGSACKQPSREGQTEVQKESIPRGARAWGRRLVDYQRPQNEADGQRGHWVRA